MGEMTKTAGYNGWPGGLFSSDDQLTVPPEFLLQADNVVIGDRGVLKPRPGLVAYGNYLDDYIIGIFCDSTLYVSTADKKLTKVSGPTVLKTYTNGGRGQFVKFKDKYCHSNGKDTMQVWTDVSATSSDAFGSPPLSRLLEVHNDRVFAAVGTTLYETEPDQAPDASTDYWATGASWAINAGSGKPITAIKSLGKQGLFVFNRDEIWVQAGYTKQERQTRLHIPGTGTIAPDSLQALKLAGFGDCIVFLGTNKKLYAVNLSGIIEIGSQVQAELDDIYEGSVADDTVPANEVKHRAVSAVHPNGWYLLGYARTATATEAAWDRCLCLHVDKPIEGGVWPFTRWVKVTGAPYEFPVSFAAMAAVYDTSRKSVMIGQKQTDDEYEVFMVRPDYEYDYDPYCSGRDTMYLPWVLKTINDNFGDDMILKTFQEVVVYSSRTRTGYVPFQFDQTIDTDTTQQSSIAIGPTVVTVNKVYRSKANLENTGSRVSITIKTNPTISNAYGYSLIGMEIRYLPAGLP